MFPLQERKLVRGCAAHIRAGLSCGADYRASVNTPLSSPFSGIISIPYFANLTWRYNQGGKWIRLTRPNGDRIEFAHNNKWIVTSGYVSAGVLIALTGNTGRITTGPHCHTQIFNKIGVRLDPEHYNWNELITADEIKQMFRTIWKREPAFGDWRYFQYRLEKGTITDRDDMILKMRFWFGVVYPSFIYSEAGNQKWQTEKAKYPL